MSAISRNHAIAAPHALLPAELDHALLSRFGRPMTPLALEPFGHGLTHAGPAAAQLLDEHRSALLAAMGRVDAKSATNEIDALLLSGPPERLPFADIEQPPLEFAEDFRGAAE